MFLAGLPVSRHCRDESAQPAGCHGTVFREISELLEHDFHERRVRVQYLQHLVQRLTQSQHLTNICRINTSVRFHKDFFFSRWLYTQAISPGLQTERAGTGLASLFSVLALPCSPFRGLCRFQFCTRFPLCSLTSYSCYKKMRCRGRKGCRHTLVTE